MKLFTEEQVRQAMSKKMEFPNDDIEKFYSDDEIINMLTPIQLPSDVDIVKNAPITSKDADDYLISNKIGFVYGAKWMKEQILNQNK